MGIIQTFAYLIRSVVVVPALISAPFGMTATAFWIYVCGLLVFITGLIKIVGELPQEHGVNKIMPFGRLFFAVPLAVFGSEHFTITANIATLVPRWIPAHTFWVYLVGVAFLCAAVSIAVDVQARLAAALVGMTLLIFVFVMDMPAVVANPGNRFFWALALRQLAFSGGAFAFAMRPLSTQPRQPLPTWPTAALTAIPRCFIGITSLFYGVEHLLHPEYVPGVPLQKLSPDWIPGRIFLSYFVGVILILVGLCLLVNKKTRLAATSLGLTILLTVVWIYLPMLLAAPTDVVALNFFFDTLLFCGAIFLLANASDKIGKGGLVPFKYCCLFASLATALVLSICVATQQTQNAPPNIVAGIPVNYDEVKVSNYSLPDPLILANGKPVRDAKTWLQKRRPEIVRMFEENQFGHSPSRPADMSFDVFDKGTPALEGKALRRQVTVYFSKDKKGPKLDLLVYLPAAARKPVPMLLNLSFGANSSTVDDPGIKPGEVWGRDKKKVPASQGRSFGRINLVPLLDARVGFATVYYGDIDPDFEGGIPYGVRALYLKPGQTQPAANEWGAIGAWAWGLSRVLDYLETDKGVDAKRVAIFGISRLGKAVLWAGAHDPRIALVIASCSGEGGAALSRRNYGETVKHLVAPTRYPYWFAANYQNHADDLSQQPVDAHLLIAAIAPRPVLLQTGDTDFWSDPKGEFLAAVAAGPVYRLLGQKGLDTDQMPAAGQPIMNTLGYYMHAGGHGTIPSDWDQFIKFLTLHLRPGT